jgi:DNA invertase Pin-like site-specific DNA recombinase
MRRVVLGSNASIAKAKAAGVYKGRPKSIEAQRVRELRAKGLGASAIAKQMGIGKASVALAALDLDPGLAPT